MENKLNFKSKIILLKTIENIFGRPKIFFGKLSEIFSLKTKSLKRLHESITNNKCAFKDGYGDVALGQCSHISRVKIGNSTDSLGRERFHPLDVRDHYDGNYPDWMYSYAKNKVKSGIECCSLESISFHYVNQQDMYKMKKSKNYLDFIFNEKNNLFVKDAPIF